MVTILQNLKFLGDQLQLSPLTTVKVVKATVADSSLPQKPPCKWLTLFRPNNLRQSSHQFSSAWSTFPRAAAQQSLLTGSLSSFGFLVG